MFRFKSLRARTLAITLPVIVLTLVLLMSMAFMFSHAQLNKELTEKMNYQLDVLGSKVEKELEAHSKVTLNMARVIEMSWAT